jgi:DNA modification methylase
VRPSTHNSLAIEYVAIAELKLNQRNPRQHRPSQIKLIRKSIRAFGFCVPPVIDRANNVIIGAARIIAARDEGFDEVPVVRLDNLSEAQTTALMLADNKLAEMSSWNEQLLGEVLHELSLLDLSFDIEATGFSMAEIDLHIDGLSDSAAQDLGDRLPNPGPAVSRPGDLWALGQHRVLCGSAIDPAAVASLMGDEKAAMIITDPPFNVRIPGHVSGNGRHKHSDFVMASGEMSEAEFTSFLESAFVLLARHSHDGSLHYVFMDWRHLGEIVRAGRGVYGELKNLCIWNKGTGGLGSLYRSQHELVFVFKSGSGPHRNNIELGKFGRNRTNVWTHAGANSFGRAGEEGDLLALHPTVKPCGLIADAILDASARGDIILDSFLGSGTTVIAAERTGRRCYGLELDPRYTDTIIRRWQAYTGDVARLLSLDRRSFAEVAEMRSMADAAR